MDRSTVETMMGPLTQIEASVVPKFDVKVLPDFTVLTGQGVPNNGMVLTHEARSKLLKVAGLPNKTLGKLYYQTASHVLTELLRLEGDLMLLHNDENIIDILPVARLRPLKSGDMLDILEDTIPGHEFHRVMRIGPHAIQIESLGEQLRDDVKSAPKGSVVQAGVVTRFSPLGISAPEVQNFVLRLVCTNGMTSTEFMNTYSSGPMDEILGWYKESVHRAYEGIHGLMSKWDHLADEGLSPTDRGMLIGGLIKSSGLNGAETAIVNARALESPPETMYDVLQLFTWAASHVVEEPLSILRAQNATADFADTHKHSMYCMSCKRAQ